MPRRLITDPFPRPPVSIPDGVMVITPNSRVARELGVQPRSLQSIAVDVLRKRGWRIASPLAAAKALRLALAREDLGILGADSIYREMIGSAVRSGVDLDKLAASESPRARALGRTTKRYVQILEIDGLVDSDAALATAVRLGLPARERVLIYGYFRARGLPARPEELDMINEIAADDSVFYLPCADLPIFSANREYREVLLRLGWEAAGEASSAVPLAAGFAGIVDADTAKPTAAVYPNIEAEVRGVLAEAKAAVLAGTALSDIAIVCRQPDQYVRLLQQTAREYGLPLKIEHKQPLAETQLGNFVSLLLDAITPIDPGGSPFEYEPTVRMFRHHAGPSIEIEAWRNARRRHPFGAEAWLAIEPRVASMALPVEPSIRSCAAWLRRLLHDWDIRGSLGSSAVEVAAYKTFIDALDELISRGDGKADLKAFAAEVRFILEDIKTDTDAAVAGIRVSQPNTIVGCHYKLLFVVGLFEGGLPEAAKDDPLIDLYERKQLARSGIYFQDATEVPRWEAATFYFTLLAGDEIRFSLPKFVDGKERLKSSYLSRIGAEIRTAGDAFVSSQRELRQAFLASDPSPLDDEISAAAKHQLAVEQQRLSATTASEYSGFIGIPVRVEGRKFSVSQLTKLGRCPFQWFAGNLLKLRRPGEADTDLAATERGSLYHKTLELAVRGSLDAPDIRTAVAANLERAFEQAEEELGFTVSAIPNWPLRRGEILESLRRLVLSDAFLTDGAEISAVEQEFTASWRGFTVTGKIDRIDRTADGLSAVDYKTGSSRNTVKDETGRLKIDIQLTIYADAIRETNPGGAIAAGRYISITGCDAEIEKPVDLAPLAARVKEIFENGSFVIDPDVDRAACRICDNRTVCRK
jgi:RecB family exonuclease